MTQIKALICFALASTFLLLYCVEAFHPNSNPLTNVAVHSNGIITSSCTTRATNPGGSGSLKDNNILKHTSQFPLNNLSRYRCRKIALHAILEPGIDSLQTIAIFAAALFILSSQREIVTPFYDIISDRTQTKLQSMENEEIPQAVIDLKHGVHKNDTNVTVAVEMSDAINDDATKPEGEVIQSFEMFSTMEQDQEPKSPKLNSPNINEMKRRVASTLASEKAKKDRLKEQVEDRIVLASEKRTGRIEFPRKSKNKQPRAIIRVVKKLLMPWKKFSQLP
jgi:hypothetical protein